LAKLICVDVHVFDSERVQDRVEVNDAGVEEGEFAADLERAQDRVDAVEKKGFQGNSLF